MKLSAPIYRLKHRAKALSRKVAIPLHDALDRIAAQEGFRSWSLLAKTLSAERLAAKIFRRLRPGHMVLVGSRPGQGKTKLGLELLAEASKSGQHGTFFTLEYTETEAREMICKVAEESIVIDRIGIDASDDISADHIRSKLASSSPGTLAVIDYLQLLDQQRTKPPLAEQVLALKSFAGERGLILVFLSQVHRSFDPSIKSCPGMDDIRLPNPLDVSLFDRRCFLHGGDIRF